MADNPFDQFDEPASGAKSQAANPFDKFDAPKKPAAAASDSSAAGDFVSGAGSALKRGVLSGIAGALPAAVGAAHLLHVNSDERDAAVFNAARALRDKAATTTSPDSLAGKAGGLVGGLGAGIATLGAGEAGGRGMDVIDQGGNPDQALKAAGISGVAAVGGLAIPGLGKGIAQRVATQGIASGLLGEGARQAENAVLPDSMHRDFDPVEAALNVGVGAAGGLIPHAAHAAVEPPHPELTQALAEQAANLERGVDARTGAQQQAALPPGQAADFVVGANGEAMSPGQAQARAAGGAGMEQQAPGGPPPPVAPAPPAGPLVRAAAASPEPLAIAHEPGFVAGPDGVAVNRYDGQTDRGTPNGGPGMDQPVPMDARAPAQSGELQPPSGPLGRATAALPPPEAPAAEPVMPRGPAPAGESGAAAQPSSLLQAYTDRQTQIDAFNTKRKAGELSPAENDQLHELNEHQSMTNPVSGMPNRRALDAAMASGKYTHAAALDIDDFKAVNDTFGHGAGDQLIQLVGQHLADKLGPDMQVFHLSGDEYAAAANGDPTARIKAAQSTLDRQPITVHWIDKEGREVDHTFGRIGLSFGVGEGDHAYQKADIASQSDKDARKASGQRIGQRRATDLKPNDGSADAAVPTAAGSDVQGVQLPGRGAVPERAAAGSGEGVVEHDAHADQTGTRARAEVPVEASGDAAARGSEGAGAPAALGTVAHGVPAAKSEPASAATAKEQRIAQSQREHFTNLADEIGWDQRGGKLLRAPEEPGQGGHAPVIGRTEWVGKPGPMGESGFWRHRPDARLTEAQAREAFRKAAAGETLKPIEQRFIDHANKTAQHYAEQEDAAREELATKRGFDSVEAMHEHDAVNMIGADHYDGAPRYDIPFSRNGEGPGMAVDRLRAAIGKIVRGWQGDAPHVEYHQSHEDAPPFLRNVRGFDRSVEGAHDPHTGTVHLFADAIKTPQRAAQVLAHEAIGHYGVEGVLGKNWGKFVSDVTALRAKAPKTLRDVFAEVDRRYPGADAETFASEAMAVMAEKGIHNALMDRVLTAMRTFLRSLGINVKLNDADLRQMLVAAQRRVEGERFQRGAMGQQHAAAFSKRAGAADGDMFGGGEKPAAVADRAPAPKSGDLFGGASSRDHVDAAVRAKEDALSGKGAAAPTMRQGEGELFAGKRPEQTHIEAAARESAAHPENQRPEPTAAQHEAGNFKMGHADVNGLDVTIEIPKGGERRGVDANGKEWSRPVSDHYGYIKRTVGADGEHLDVYLGPHAHEPDARVFVVDQVKKGTGKFDEHKAMIGYKTQAEAVASYRANFPADMNLVGSVKAMSMDDFKSWVKKGELKKPAAQARFSKADEQKPTVAYAGDRFVQRDRLAQRKFDKPYAKLSPEDKADVDALFQTTSAAKNPMFSKADTAADIEKPSFLDRASGLIRPGAAEQAANAVKKLALNARDLARGVSKAAWAQRDRAVGTADAAIDAFRSHFDARPADVRSDPLKSYDSVIAYQQKRPIADPTERSFIGTMAKMLDQQASAIRAFGEDKLGLLDQYFPQLWKDPVRAEKLYADMQAKRPLAGAKGFTKERVFADYEQGIKAGMQPAFDNPADALMARYQSGERYLSALRIRDGIDKLGLLQDIGQGDRVPAGFARVNDNTFAGKVVPELVAKDLNNYLAPGLSQFAAWRNFRWLQNTLLSARLGFSFFHAGFTTVDSAMTSLDLGMGRALSGDIAAALKNLAEVPLAPLKAVQGLFGKGEGAKLVRQFYGKDAIDDPHTAAVLHALTEGGARGRMDPTDYNNDFAQSLRTLRTDGVKALAKTPLRTLGAVLEGVMRPIAHNLVPAQKMTARVQLMKYELDRVAQKLGKDKGDYAGIVNAMDEHALRQIAGDVVQRVDDRLGQLAYDNLFWNRTVKDILQASIQSVGWNVGTKNVIFGGLGDVRKIFKPDQLLAPLDKGGKITDAQMSRVTGRLSYLVALNMGIGMLGAVTQYMLTGEGPQELRDYFFPKTGNKNPDGSDARISFPSYVKDEFGFARHPIDTVQHKLHPSFSMVAELLNNKDFYGNQVFNPDDPWTKVAGQVATHIAAGFVPYAVQNQSNVAAAGGGIGARVAPFIGVTPAPGDITHSDFQNYVSEKYFASHPSGEKSPEQADRSHQFMQAASAMRRGEKPDLTEFTPKERASLQRYVQHDPIETHFTKLNLEQKLHAYDRATDAERKQYNLRQKVLSSKWSRDLEQEPDPDTREELRARVQALIDAK